MYNFLYKLIDYAGLFPPAQLPIEHSLKNYSEYIQSTDKWMMSQFIIPVSRLNEISSDLMEYYSEEFPLRLSLISPDICKDMDIVNQFLNKYGDIVSLSGHESQIIDIGTLTKKISDVHRLKENSSLKFESFYEVPSSDTWIAQMNEAVTIISDFNAEHNASIGFKVRCGGVKAHMFPKAEMIAQAISACRDASVPMKFTAGLHHPVRRYSESVKAKMYGFFNIFIAGMIAHKFSLQKDLLTDILLDETPNNFKFDTNGLHWKKYSILNSEIQSYRQKFIISYGSCSFNEPRSDLKKLGLL